MIVSQLLLIGFTAEWLHVQYNNQKDQLQKDLAKLFTDVQQKVTDSIRLQNIFGTPANTSTATNQKTKEEINTTLLNKGDSFSPVAVQQMRMMISRAKKISNSEENDFFRIDTTIFNEIFTSRMGQNGMYFSARWINNKDSALKAKDKIFIRSNFFTNNNGVVIGNYSWYLIKRLLPQFLFILVLLSITTTAFIVTYRSLREQMKLGQLKNDFISNMSHELKTPIATVKVALEALNNFNVIEHPTMSREYLQMATLEIGRLEQMANEVLNTSLLESNKLFIQPEKYDLKKLVQDVIQAFQLRLQQCNATINLNAIGNNFQCFIDKFHTQGVLVNLLDNSLKYGGDPVNIIVTLTEMEETVQLSVSDNGPGIPEEYIDKVFDKFFRVPTGNRHNTKGHGLGLSYAAQVMQQHHGTIRVNNGIAGGCIFTLTF